MKAIKRLFRIMLAPKNETVIIDSVCRSELAIKVFYQPGGFSENKEQNKLKIEMSCLN